MRELRVEDALLYLDQVKVEFGDRPHIYNEFLDIMKTFKTQQIDTPGVIRRVSNLFQGNRKLVLGFNTFLPEGYKIEIPVDGDGPPVAVYRAPGSNVAHILRESAESQAHTLQPSHAPSHGPTAAAMPPMRHAAHPQHPHAGVPQQGQRMAQAPTADPYAQKPMPMQHSQGAAPPPVVRSQPQPQQQMSAARTQHPMEQASRQSLPGVAHRPPQPQQAAQQQQQPAGMAGRQQQPGVDGKGAAAASRMAAGMNGQAMRPPELPPPPEFPPQPLEFDHAINYVTTIKKRFASEPDTYRKFLEILHTYQKEQRGIKEVLDEVSELFADHPDLLKEFTYFLPDAVQVQAKQQLDQAVKEAEARKRAKAKKAIMTTAQGMQRQAQQRDAAARSSPEYERGGAAPPVPFGATQGRPTERETAIVRGAHFGIVSFDPVRPPRRNELTPAQAALKNGRPTAIPELPLRPNAAETAFFDRAKDHLNRKELASDKPAGSRRHTPYTEFLKCLHLYGAGILNKDELLLLLKGLFMQGHAPKSGINATGGNFNPIVAHDAGELLREFEELMVGRGSYADQQRGLKDKSQYGAIRTRDFDFSNSECPTPSYRTYPADYPQSLFITNTGLEDIIDDSVLNDIVVCVPPLSGSKRRVLSIEENDGARMRHNAYEEALFRIEDERYELDMAIERNTTALRQIEPFAEEVQKLREEEEKDGQPIGRLQYRLNRYAMNTVHINAIGRIYGERADEILQNLVRNPLIVLPIVYQRLKQKDAEWRKAKTELVEKWNASCEESYEGSMDVRCYFNRRELERTFATPILLEECKRAKSYCKHPEKQRDDEATLAFRPAFGLSSSDPGAILYQPYVAVQCKVDVSHKEAFQLVAQQIKESSSSFDRERIGRIWAEFVVPWFGYSSYWAASEVRESFGGKMNPHIVKFALGQRVVTAFGEGTIVSFSEADRFVGPKYRVKLPFGTAHMNPSAILFAIPSADVSYVRRDGLMERDESPIANGNAIKLDEKYQLLFGTESIYIFMRLYSLLCSILSDTRDHCETFDSPADPTMSYHNPANNDARKKPAAKLSYSSVLSALKKVLAKKMDAKDYEALGRKLSKEKVHQMAALPKLIERCGEALTKIAKEDALLHLYDYCQYREADPVALRAHCSAVAPDAAYRIQYDSVSGSLYFSYVPKGEDLFTAPGMDMNSNDVAEEEEAPDMNGTHGDDPMEQDEDPIEEFDDGVEVGPPFAKRLKLKHDL